MCGFGGIFNSSIAWDNSSVLNIASKVNFRGPDNTTVRIFDSEFNISNQGHHSVFFNRLSILDLDSRSNQPFENERYFLLFNGEIYNYKEIKTVLADLGVSFQTTSDTEVLFYALVNWGKDAIGKLNGMFSFVFFDKEKHSFIIARDRMGIKPLYYKQDKNSLIFASEADSIIRFSGEKASIDNNSISYYLHLQYIPTPFTIYKDIFKLAPGHYLTGNVNDLKSENILKQIEFWNANNIIEKRNTDSISFESLLVNSIQSQLQSDVPIGFFLSSGIDSSLLAAIVHKHFSKGQRFDFFTVAFEEKTISDESNDAFEYLKGFNNPNFNHHKLRVDSDFIMKSIEDHYSYYDEPFGDHASLLNRAISVKAKEYVTVALSGDGGDELFWGYLRYQFWKEQMTSSFKKLPFGNLSKSFVNIIPLNKYKRGLLWRIEKDPIKVYLNLHAINYVGSDLLENECLWWYKNLKQHTHREDLPSLIDIKTYLPDAMLYKVDRSSMAASLEVRVPFLDNGIIDYSLQIPFQQKSNNLYKSKYPLKDLLNKLAPHYNINKTKQGFNFPLEQWMKSKWDEQILSLVTKSNLEELGILPQPYLRRLASFYGGKEHHPEVIWYLYNLILWYNASKIKNLI